MRNTQQESIAIIGMGCRFPRANNLQEFWTLLREGRDAIQEVPANRWDIQRLYDPDRTVPGKTVSRWGGFLDQIDQFDWRAFRMLPREATAMDPQHRLLLEVAWEALEDAGLPFEKVAGSQTSVSIGIGWNDYLRLRACNWSQLDEYTAIGNTDGVAAHRLSYFFDLKGPSVAVNSLCTSGLSALHLACQSLWTGEANLALAGGVSLTLSPDSMIMVSKAGLLSLDGRCKTLDAAADGYVRGEGAGIIVLKPLSQVSRSDRVYALIRGIAVNHNGHNEWIIAASQTAQEALLRDAYCKAGVNPAFVDYVELHGTGFQRGDSIETKALGAVLGSCPERTHPCFIGSVKTNIGHLDAASGMASVIKVALSLSHRYIPPTLNLEKLNPDIPLDDLHLAVPEICVPWPEKVVGGQAQNSAPATSPQEPTVPHVAGVTTLAFSGANAHAVLSAYAGMVNEVPSVREKDDENVYRLLPLSATSKQALHGLAVAYRNFLMHLPDVTYSWRDICYSASVRRTHHSYRLAVLGLTPQEAAEELWMYLQNQDFAHDSSADIRQEPPTRLEVLKALYTKGAKVDWSELYHEEDCHCVSLPTYSWQRERLWPDWLNVEEISTPPEERISASRRRDNLPISNTLEMNGREVVDVLTELWADVLGLEKVDAFDSFFELGGHSLLAQSLLARIREVFQVELALKDFLAAPKPSACAELIKERVGTGAIHGSPLMRSSAFPSELPQVEPDPTHRYEPFPLTDLQQAYWVGRTNTFALGDISIHLYLEYESDQLDLERFSQAWNLLIKRHEMLRAVLLPDGQQRILPETPLYSIAISDLCGKAEPQREAELLAIRERLSHQVLPLDQWPLFEICAATLDERRTRLFLSIDALVCDYSSWRLLYRELSLFYENVETKLPPLELSFRDYVLAEARIEHSPLYQRSLSYWTARLETLPPAPNLPMVKTVEQLRQIRFKRWELSLSAEKWAQIKARASQTDLTPSVVLLAAFAQVLALWSTNTCFTLNVPLMHRLPLHPQTNAVMGGFSSFTLLEVDCSKPCSFLSLAKRIQTQLWEDMSHQYVSGVRLLRELMRLRQGFTAPLMPIVYTSTLVWEKTLHGETDVQAETFLDHILSQVSMITQTPQVLLDFQVLDQQSHGLHLNWDVVEEVFPPGLIDDMFATYCHLLEQLTDEVYWSSPTQHPLPRWQEEVLARANATEAPQPQESLAQLFEQQVALRPSQLAIVAPHKRFTYQELAGRVNRLARLLRTVGARPNRLVAVVMEKGWEQAVAALSILTAGAAYVPLDPTLPPERLGLLLQQAQVEIVLTQSWLALQPSCLAERRRFYVDAEALSEWDSSPLSAVQTPEDLAYVMYTSGSTGQPKGVMIAQRGVVNCLAHTQETFQIGPQDRVLALTALHHDMSVFDLFGTLAAGGTIVFPDTAGVKDPAQWAALLQQEQITIWNSVPAMMEMLQEQIKKSGQEPLLPDSLRLVFLGGDWIPISVVESLQQWRPSIEVVSVGGPTETTVWNIWYRVGQIDPQWKSIPYGQPIANTRYYILNERMEPCPMWVRGELYCAGVGVAQGYWADEERTRACFVQHPQTGERLYRTGDLGCYHPDGTIEFLGRADFQAKIRGQRIELGEIEAVLQQHPLVRGAVVTVSEDQRLLAYVVKEQPEQSQGTATDVSAGLFSDALDGVTLTEPFERARFKLRQPALRQDVHKRAFQLPLSQINEAFLEPYKQHRSRRNFCSDPLDLLTLSQFLTGLYQVEIERLFKYRYASSGGLYPVQTYLYVKAGRVNELDGGIYYYHPKHHQLILLSAEAHLDSSIHAEHNQHIFEACAFEIFLIAHMDAIEPMYGKLARDFCLLDAGYMGHHLMLMAEERGLGLCPVGGLDFERIRPLFAVHEQAVLVHSLLGGLALQAEHSKGWPYDERILPRANASSPTLTDQLAEYLRAKLPAHMIPSAFVQLGTFPLTPNGKVDRQSLPILDQSLGSPRGQVDVPRTAVEESVVGLWREVLGHPSIGIHDNFFARGGHSLQGIRLLSRVKELFQVEISLSRLFEAPTVAEMARSIEDALRNRRDNSALSLSAEFPPLVPDLERRYEPFPTTDVQQAYWLGRYVAPDGMVGIHGYMEVEAVDLDLKRFNWILHSLIERHEMLRAVLLPDGQQQILERVPPFQVKILDLRAQDQEEQTRQLAQIRHMLDHQLLSVEQWPAFEIWVSRLDDRQVRLHFSMEAIFVDAWNMKTLIHEFIRLYHEPDLVLPPLTLSFRDYVLAEASLRSSAAYQRAREYWTQRLSSLPPAPLLPLVSETARTWKQPHFVHREGTLKKEQWQRLKARASKIGVTPSAVLLTAFALVLTRWSKTAHFSLNVSTFNRLPLHPSVNEIVGDFTSLSLLAVDHTTPASFEKRAKRLQEQLWLDLDHSSYSGVQVLRELAKIHGEGFKALMPIVFTSLLIEDTASPLPPPWGKMHYSVMQTPQVWLDNQVLEIAGELGFHWQSVDAIFPAGLIDDMFATYCQLLQDLSRGEASWSEEHRPLLPEQQRALLAHVNKTRAPVAEDLLHTLFLKQVAQHPDQLALISPTRRFTYKQVASGALQLAHQLRNLEIGSNQLVGVVMEKGWEQVVAIIGILQSGAAYLPLDAHLPGERLRYLLKDGQLRVVVTQSWVDGQIAWPKDMKRIWADSLDLDEEAIPELASVQGPDDLAYMIYTSGSTGIPKGVMISHRSAVNTILDINQRFGISSSDRVLALSALNFDLSVYDIFGLLAAGGTIVLPDEKTVRDTASWLTMLEQEQVTIWNTVPALLQILVEYAEGHHLGIASHSPSEMRTPCPYSRLRLALLSGDWIPLNLPERLRKLCPEIEVVSLGGATEASIWSILYPISTLDPAWKSIPYGRPMKNQQVFVLDKQLEPCPVWVAGDLYIAGVGLAKGYWKEEEKTHTSFFIHPHTGVRLYRTGDRGRHLPDGTIEFLGREDFQVKVQGHRIELGEIEVTLTRHPDVDEAVVLALGESRGEKRLAAYVVAKSGQTLTTDAVQRFLAASLPGYMVPASFHVLDALPRTPNGKVDRKALAAHAPSLQVSEPSRETASAVAEQKSHSVLQVQISHLVADVLGVEQIDPTRNLLEYDATSMDIFRIANRLESKLHMRPELSQLFSLFSIEAIAAYCEQCLSGLSPLEQGEKIGANHRGEDWEEIIL